MITVLNVITVELINMLGRRVSIQKKNILQHITTD